MPMRAAACCRTSVVKAAGNIRVQEATICCALVGLQRFQSQKFMAAGIHFAVIGSTDPLNKGKETRKCRQWVSEVAKMSNVYYI